MKPSIPIRRALSDKKLLGGVLAGDSWKAWRVLLIAAMGEPLFADERVLFKQLTGREREPGQRVEELVGVIGRRGGKSRAMATSACYTAALCKHDLVHGERGVLLCIAPDQKQAGIVLDYATAAFEASPILKQLIANRTADTLELTNGISIEVRAASFRRLRGPTYIAVIADEVAFWLGPENNSANPDSEILAAVKPGLSTTGGPLFMISSPYARRGELWNVYKKHYGPDGDPLVLVAQGASRTFNATLSQRTVDRALERDHAAASAEYLAQFRSDIETFVSYEVAQACVGDYPKQHPLAAITYYGFVDPSGGSEDSFTMAIAHADGEERCVIDLVDEITPPFSPSAVTEEFAALLKSYRITSVCGDRYGGEFSRELFRRHGIEYRVAEKTKSELYANLLPLLNDGRITLPRHDRLLHQLVGLERNTARGSGKPSIDHPRGMHDDVANAVAGAASLAIDKGRYVYDLENDSDTVIDPLLLPKKRLHPNLSDEMYERIRRPLSPYGMLPR